MREAVRTDPCQEGKLKGLNAARGEKLDILVYKLNVINQPPPALDKSPDTNVHCCERGTGEGGRTMCTRDTRREMDLVSFFPRFGETRGTNA